MATSSSDRLAYYNPGTDEYDRFAEDSSILEMSNSNNQIAYSVDGEILFFADMENGMINAFGSYTGEYLGYACSLGNSWNPLQLKVNPYDGHTFVADYIFGGSLIYFPQVCWDQRGDQMYAGIFNMTSYRIEDFAFGGTTHEFVYVLTKYQPTFNDYVYKVDLANIGAAPARIASFSSTGSLYTAIEAAMNGNFFLSKRYSDFSGRIESTCVDGFDSNGVPLPIDFCPFIEGRPIDAWGIKLAPNGLLYASDYSFDLPIAIDPVSGRTLGRLGTSFGMLIFAHHFDFFPGPFGPRCKVSLATTQVVASKSLLVVVELYDASSEPFCFEPYLTAVQGGTVFIEGNPSKLPAINTYDTFTQEAPRGSDGCHRWSISVPAELASLIYKDTSSSTDDTKYDPRLIDWAASKGIDPKTLDPVDYQFSIKIFSGELDFNLEIGDSSESTYAVSPHEPDPSKTSVEGGTMREFLADMPSCVNITTKDSYENALLYGGSAGDFAFEMEDMGTFTRVESESNEHFLSWRCGDVDSTNVAPLKVTVRDNQDGSYEICSIFGPAGVHFMDVKLKYAEDGDVAKFKDIATSPLAAVVSAGPIDPSMTFAYGDGIEFIQKEDGKPNIFYVRPKDNRGNPVQLADLQVDSIQVKIEYGLEGSYSGDMKVEYKVRALQSEGELEVTYNIVGDLKEDLVNKIRVTVTESKSGDYVMINSGGGTSSPVNNVVVQQTERTLEYKINPAMKAALIAESVFLLALTIIFAGLVKYWEMENAIRFSQRKFLYIILIGMSLLYLSFLFLLIPSNNTICAAENFIFHLGCWIVMLALSAKTYRTNKIANNKGLKRVKITDAMLLRQMGVVMFLVVAALIAQAVFYPPEIETMYGNSRETESGVRIQYVVKQCTAGTSPVSVVIFASELAGLGYLAVLAHFTRKVPSAFAEAKYIAISIYNICLIIAFMAVLVGVVEIPTDYPDLFMGLTGFAVFMGVGMGQILIFVPKFLLIVKKKEVKMEDILPTQRTGTHTSFKYQKDSEMVTTPMGERASSSSGGSGRGNAGSRASLPPNFGSSFKVGSQAIGSMQSVMEDTDLSGSVDEGARGAGGVELERAKKIEQQLRKDIERQQREIEKMKTLNKQLQEQTKKDQFSKRRSSSLSPMPPGNSDWQAFEDDDGKTYYYNSRTFACQYEIPKRW